MYLDDLLNIDNPYFEGMVKQIYPPELQMNKANATYTEAPFLDLYLSFANGFVFSKIHNKRDDFDFDIVNFPCFWLVTFLAVRLMMYTFCNLLALLESAIMLRTSMREIKVLHPNFSSRAVVIINFEKKQKTFSKLYCGHSELISKFNVGPNTLLREGLSELEFYGDLVYKFNKLI